MNNSGVGLYIHIPFCDKRCKYCSFYSTINKNNRSETNYLNALIKHIDFFRLKSDTCFSSIYFGGGTPSTVSADFYFILLSKISAYFNVAEEVEITIELNPEHISKSYLLRLKEVGINRVSIGVQSLDDRVLSKLNRIHSAKKAVNSVETALTVFDNVSCDFIVGIKDAPKEVENIVNFKFINSISHLSLYMLEGEKNIALMEDEDKQAKNYLILSDILEETGFYHYEISNFAKEGKTSKHNCLYWTGNEYIGIGPSAHSFFYTDGNIRRIAEKSSLNDFLENKFKPYLTTYSKNDYINEMFMLRLRLSQGVNVAYFNSRYKVDITKKCKKLSDKFGSLVVFDGKQIYLTKKGFLLSNNIFADII
jgi:oxygen-independent coproporphyrinogen-3 oxidase